METPNPSRGAGTTPSASTSPSSAMGLSIGHTEPRSTTRIGVEWAVGGRAVRVRSQSPASPRRGGGRRGQVTALSRKSRAQLRRLLASIDRGQVRPNQVLALTLTYPGEFPTDPEVWRRHLKNLKRRLEKAWGKMAVVWKLEPQGRGAAHWHLLVFEAGRVCRMRQFRSWLSSAWYEVVASGDERHLRAGTTAHRIRSWRHFERYAARYLSKKCSPMVNPETGEVRPVGRWWSIWNRSLLPIERRFETLSPAATTRLLRLLRGYWRSRERRYWRSRERRILSRWQPISSDVIEKMVRWAAAGSSGVAEPSVRGGGTSHAAEQRLLVTHLEEGHRRPQPERQSMTGTPLPDA